MLVGCASDGLVMETNVVASDADPWTLDDVGRLRAISSQYRRKDKTFPLPAIWQWVSQDDFMQYEHEVWDLSLQETDTNSGGTGQF